MDRVRYVKVPHFNHPVEVEDQKPRRWPRFLGLGFTIALLISLADRVL